jgi:hypothetical protein
VVRHQVCPAVVYWISFWKVAEPKTGRQGISLGNWGGRSFRIDVVLIAVEEIRIEADNGPLRAAVIRVRAAAVTCHNCTIVNVLIAGDLFRYIFIGHELEPYVGSDEN